tara:strand:- start:3754 stop:4128 length:375 start_codon:yes stop_codon:yes gene_type:complete
MSSWNSQNRVVTAYPGPRDSFVVTLGGGRRLDVCSVEEYDTALARASRLAQDTKMALKVLPMTAAELINFAGIKASDLAATPEADSDLRRQVVTTLREAMVEADDRETRVEAQALLAGMGEAPC